MLFAFLTGVVTVSSALLARGKKELLVIALSSLIAFFLMKTAYGILGLGILVLSPRIKSYPLFAHANLLSTVLVASSLLWYYEQGMVPGSKGLTVFFALLIGGLSVYGIFEQRMYRFLAASSLAQTSFVALDLSVAFTLTDPGILKTVQVFNYVLAGSLLFVGIGMVAWKKERLSDLMGSWFVSRWADVFTVIACLSLAGLPGFNIFVSEWALFSKGFEIDPLITLLGIFLAMMLFIMYYKIAYYLLAGPGRRKKEDRLRLAFSGLLAAAVVILGLLPWVQEMLLEVMA